MKSQSGSVKIVVIILALLVVGVGVYATLRPGGVGSLGLLPAPRVSDNGAPADAPSVSVVFPYRCGSSYVLYVSRDDSGIWKKVMNFTFSREAQQTQYEHYDNDGVDEEGNKTIAGVSIKRITEPCSADGVTKQGGAPGYEDLVFDTPYRYKYALVGEKGEVAKWSAISAPVIPTGGVRLPRP